MYFKIFLCSFLISIGFPAIAGEVKDVSAQSTHEAYLHCLERVYETMNENYYKPVSRETFKRFVKKFDKGIYEKLDDKTQKNNFVCWRSAAYLVDQLKDQEDTFSAFYPPKAAKEYEMTALDKRVDLGIEGELTPAGYLVNHVEFRSDAYVKGLREEDVIFAIDNKSILDLTLKEIQSLLSPLADSKVKLRYLERETKIKKEIETVSREFFQDSVFLKPVDVPGIFCLQIRHFNRMTGDDLKRVLFSIQSESLLGLIIDLRDNPGGPPLAAREISAFFLPAGEYLAYFEKKGQPISYFLVPKISKKYRYDGPLAILVNKGSGSSSELFSGILQKLGRAELIGAPTAGKVLLKSMFPYEDDSMLLLVTARGHLYDGSVFPFTGLVPDIEADEHKTDIVSYAANYLKAKIKKNDRRAP